MNSQARAIIVRALAHNANPDEACMVLSLALDGLKAEAKMLREAHENDLAMDTLLFSHESRLQALEDLFDNYMTAKWIEPTKAELDAAE